MTDIFNWIYDGVQDVQVRSARLESMQARHSASDVQIKLRQVEKEHERLKLMVIAMWELLKERTSLSDDELTRFIEKIDMKDGKRDGRVGTRLAFHSCGDCSHKIPDSALTCPYCGSEQPRSVGS